MAEYYIAPKSSFDATADAIREKTGSQATIEWTEDGFADAIDAIPGGYTANDIATKNISGVITIDTSSTIDKYSFYNCTSITGLSIPNSTVIDDSAFYGCSGLSGNGLFPMVTKATGNSFHATGYTSIELPKLTWISWGPICRNCPNLELIRLGSSDVNLSGTNTFGDSWFRDLPNLETIIFGWENGLVKLGGVAAFNNSPFASGGTGGTIYISKALYDHLGDGTSLDYKAATNWSTIDGYGTITWAQIEGSQYENYYADGTPIPTA